MIDGQLPSILDIGPHQSSQEHRVASAVSQITGMLATMQPGHILVIERHHFATSHEPVFTVKTAMEGKHNAG